MIKLLRAVLPCMLIAGSVNLFGGHDEEFADQFSQLSTKEENFCKKVLKQCSKDEAFVIFIKQLKLDEKIKEFEQFIQNNDVDGAEKWLQSFRNELLNYTAKMLKRDKQSGLVLQDLINELKEYSKDKTEVNKVRFDVINLSKILSESKKIIPITREPRTFLKFTMYGSLVISGAAVVLMMVSVFAFFLVSLSFLDRDKNFLLGSAAQGVHCIVTFLGSIFVFSPIFGSGIIFEEWYNDKYAKELKSIKFQEAIVTSIDSIIIELENIKKILWSKDESNEETSLMIDINEEN